jgi:hypothetical protein
MDLITSAAATVDVNASWVDINTSTLAVAAPGRTNTAITTATTTTIVAGPASGSVRNVKSVFIRNRDTANACIVTARINISGGTICQQISVNLNPGDTLEFVEGVGWFVVTSTVAPMHNQAVASQSGFAADTYLVGSSITMPASLPQVGTTYKLVMDIAKTAAGVVAPVLTLRFGVNGTVADAALCTFTFGAQTAAVDQGTLTIPFAIFRTVGAATAAVVQAIAELRHQLASTGLTVTGTAGYAELGSTSAGFNSTVAGSIIGASLNAGASAAWTITGVRAELYA